ncbi:MAG: hypothetical protein PHO80_05295, partial [Candidatus Gracilibacteria bacterium]|nr:hypothetical protein [Candidatus Gracilibacteria bacterium]
TMGINEIHIPKQTDSFLPIIDLIKESKYNEVTSEFNNILTVRLEKLNVNHNPDIIAKVEKIRNTGSLIIKEVENGNIQLQDFVTILSKLDTKLLGLEIQINNLEHSQINGIGNLIDIQFDENQDGITTENEFKN